MNDARLAINKAVVFAVFAMLGAIIPILGIILATIGFYFASKADIEEYPKLKQKKANSMQLLALAVIVCIGSGLLWFMHYNRQAIIDEQKRNVIQACSDRAFNEYSDSVLIATVDNCNNL